jgi:hypothetical protein
MTRLDPAGLEAAAKDLIEAYDAWSVNSYPADGGSSTHVQAWFQEAQHVENAVEKLRAAYLSVQEQPAICGVICACGAKGEPLACGFTPRHDGGHSWATLPTFGGDDA